MRIAQKLFGVLLACLAFNNASKAQTVITNPFPSLLDSSYRVIVNRTGTQPETLGTNIAGTTYTRLDGRLMLQSARVAALNPRVIFSGLQVAQNAGSSTTAAGDTGNPNDIFLQMAFEVGGINLGLLTYNGNSNFNIPAGYPPVATDTTGSTLPAATQFYLRLSQSIDVTYKSLTRPYNAGPSNFQYQVSYSTNASGQATGTGTITVANASSTAWQPITVIGVPQGVMTAVGWLGMSITGGTGDSNPNTYGDYGWISKGIDAVSPNIPRLGISRGSSETIDYLNAAATRIELLRYVDAVFYDLGTNDIAVGAITLANLQTNALQIWKQVRSLGKGLYAVTAIPRVTATSISITSLTSAGTTTVTATVASTANLTAAKSQAVVSGATPVAYNGTFTVASVVDATHFTYTALSVPGSSPATGTLLYNTNFSTIDQTPVTGFATSGIRDQYNSWLYTECQGGIIDGLIDPALGRYALCPTATWVNTAGGGVEDPSNLSKWITTSGAGTIDGTHPSSSTATNAVSIAAATMTAFVTAKGW